MQTQGVHLLALGDLLDIVEVPHQLAEVDSEVLVRGLELSVGPLGAHHLLHALLDLSLVLLSHLGSRDLQEGWRGMQG